MPDGNQFDRQVAEVCYGSGPVTLSETKIRRANTRFPYRMRQCGSDSGRRRLRIRAVARHGSSGDAGDGGVGSGIVPG